VKLLTEYLDRAVSLERLAAGGPDSTFKNVVVVPGEGLQEAGYETGKGSGPATAE